MQIEGRSELSDIVEEEEDLSTEDAGESKPKILCKVESINEENEMQNDELEKNRTDTQDYQSKPSHAVRRINQTNQSNPQVPTQRRQGWKDQSYNTRSMAAADGNGDLRGRREHRNSSGQVVLDPDENLSDKEIYPSSRANIPSIAVKDSCLNYKVTKELAREDNGFSDDEYDPRRRPIQRPSSPERYPPTSSQQRPLRTEPDPHQNPNSRTHRGPQSHYSQQQPHPHRAPRRQSHDSVPARCQPHEPVPTRDPVPTRNPNPTPQDRQLQRVPQQQPHQERGSSRNHGAQRVQAPPDGDRGPTQYYSKRRSSESGTNAPNRRGSEYHDPMSRYDDPGNYDSYASHAEGGDNRVRFFVALFDYDPQTMSPNPDAADEELPFQEGQMIKIYGDKDPDGFYRGESNGRMGLVPGNMVSEVQVDVDSSYYNDNTSRPRSLGHMAMDERDIDYQSRRIKKMVAMYDYDPQEISPNVDAEIELSFSTGDVIYVIGDVDEDGFYMGELNGVKGLVPSNFLREVPLEEDDKRQGGGRPKGVSRDDYPHTKNAVEVPEHSRGHTRGSEKQHYATNTGHKGAAASSGYAPPTTLWDDRDFEREPAPRGPHIPPRGQRMAHQQAFTGPPQPPDQHW